MTFANNSGALHAVAPYAKHGQAHLLGTEHCVKARFLNPPYSQKIIKSHCPQLYLIVKLILLKYQVDCRESEWANVTTRTNSTPWLTVWLHSAYIDLVSPSSHFASILHSYFTTLPVHSLQKRKLLFIFYICETSISDIHLTVFLIVYPVLVQILKI